MSNPITLGIVGAGNVVSVNHLPVLKALPGVQVSWIADKDPARAHRVAQAYGIPEFDIGRGLDNLPAADAILLGIPYGVREPYYTALAQRGVAVYVEKPFARTLAMHRRLCDSFADYRLACGLNRRAWGLVRFLREVVESHLLGPVRRVRFGLGSAGGITVGGHYMADPGIAGGGMLFETGVHGIDTVLYCLDARSSAVDSGKLIMENGHDVHCEAVLSLETPGGAKVPFEIEVSRLKNTIERVEFEFDYSIASFGLFGSSELRLRSRNGKANSFLTDCKNLYPFTWNQVLGEFWKEFLGGVQRRLPNYTSATQSFLTTEVVEQLYSLAGQQ